MVTKAIQGSQVKVESHHFDIRKHLVEYDDVVNTQRDVIYRRRNKVLDGSNVREEIQEIAENADDWDIEA